MSGNWCLAIERQGRSFVKRAGRGKAEAWDKLVWQNGLGVFAKNVAGSAHNHHPPSFSGQPPGLRRLEEGTLASQVTV